VRVVSGGFCGRNDTIGVRRDDWARWGSCSTNGRVSFNIELLRLLAAFRRRVIAGELLHLKVPNHGKLFRSLLKAHLGAR
jgi:predicted metal-dependent hydrolase